MIKLHQIKLSDYFISSDIIY